LTCYLWNGKKIIMSLQSSNILQIIYIKHCHFFINCGPLSWFCIFENFTHLTYFDKNISKISLLEFENFNSKISCFTPTFTEIFQFRNHSGWKIEIFSVTLVPIDTRQFPQSTIFHRNFSVSKQFWLKNWIFYFHFSSHWYPSIPT